MIATAVKSAEPKAIASVVDIAWLRGLSMRLLARMYVPAERLFVFRWRRVGNAIISEGRSRRYTSIVLIGLASEAEEIAGSILGDASAGDVCGRLVDDLSTMENLGDAALTLWAARALGHAGQGPALDRVLAFGPGENSHPTVDLAWTLTALSVDEGGSDTAAVRDAVARRLIAAFDRRSSLFPHVIGAAGMRSHVCCFADLVYPVQALAQYHRRTGDAQAIDAARRCADQFCRLQGAGGQWWWHYDVRTGRVVEGYPVYSVHQDGMAPMSLFALQDACGTDYGEAIRRGLDWLVRCPELGGRSIIDHELDILWRKVARREPRKLTRRVQAVASRVHSALRMPGTDWLFPAGAIDFECRPYHLGWLLHAFPAERAGFWRAGAREPTG